MKTLFVPGSRCHRLAFWIGLLLVCVSMSGCSREFYRRQADVDAYSLIQQKTCDPQWPLDGYTINVDPASRMYDPTNIDCPPMPPDDPTAHKYMHCVDGKSGWPCWHANGDTNDVENPNWEQFLPRCPSGNVLIDEPTAMCLALLNSPTYQRELEDLYLAALDVSFERFRFDTQFFGGESLILTADGRDRSGTGESSSRLDLSTRNWQARKLFSAGGELVVGLANSILWQFAGPTTNATNTLLDFSFIQPLLRRGGRDFVLERLTLAERVLLGNVRLMERFRDQFYVQILTGRFANGGPSRRGGVFGGSGLEGFSGVGGGGFGQLNIGGGGFQAGNGGFAGGAGAGQAGGFLGLVQLQQNIRNQQANVASLESSVSQLEAFFKADRIDYFQVELARQALFNAQSLLLNSRLAYENQKDSFKQTLGLPPHIIIEVDDALIQSFQLIGADAIELQNELTQIQRQLGDAVIGILTIADEAVSELDRTKSTRNDEAPDLESGQSARPANRSGTSEPAARPNGANANGGNSDDLDDALESLDRQSRNNFDHRQRSVVHPVYAASYTQSIDQSTLPEVEVVGAQQDGGVQQEHQSTDETRPGATSKESDAGTIYDRDRTTSSRAVPAGPELNRQLEAIRAVIGRAGDICGTITSDQIPAAEKDIEKLAGRLEGRKSQMQRLRRMIEAQLEEEAETCGDDPPPAVDVDAIISFDPERLANLPKQLKLTTVDVKTRVDKIATQLDSLEKVIAELSESGGKGNDKNRDARQLYRQLSDKLLATAPSTLNELSANLLSVILVQVRARTQNAELVPVELDWHEAVEIAREHRLDWMNARASLVDSWRLIQFNTDALQSNLDFVFSGDIGNVGDNPLDLRGSKGRLRVGVQFDAPLTRLSERNTYRQALIEYQQARRAYYQYQDQVTTDLRTTLRGLRVNQVNFELRRGAIEVAIAQVELARLRLQEPPKPEEEANLGATTARDLVSALSDLLNVQNDFLSVWINHESLRRSLDLDLGTMQLDNCGRWIDPGPILRLDDGKNNPTEIQFDENMMSIEAGELKRMPIQVDPLDDSDVRPQPEAPAGELLPAPQDVTGVFDGSQFEQSMKRLPSAPMPLPRVLTPPPQSGQNDRPNAIQRIAPFAVDTAVAAANYQEDVTAAIPANSSTTPGSLSLFKSLYQSKSQDDAP